MKNLYSLGLSNTQVSDLSPLAELKNLETLTLNDTQVSDLSSLAELKDLKTLRLNDTAVIDLLPLAELKSLRFLYLHNTGAHDPYAPSEEYLAMFGEVAASTRKRVSKIQSEYRRLTRDNLIASLTDKVKDNSAQQT